MSILRRWGITLVFLSVLAFHSSRGLAAAYTSANPCAGVETGIDLALVGASIFSLFGPAGAAIGLGILVSATGAQIIARYTMGCGE